MLFLRSFLAPTPPAEAPGDVGSHPVEAHAEEPIVIPDSPCITPGDTPPDAGIGADPARPARRLRYNLALMAAQVGRAEPGEAGPPGS